MDNVKLQTACMVFFLLLRSWVFSAGHDITSILGEHGEVSTFNRLLSVSNIAAEINERESLTVLAPDNFLLQSLEDSNLPMQDLADILRHYVILQYIGEDQLENTSNIESLASAMAAEKMDYRASSIVRKLAEVPEKIRVFQINKMLFPIKAKTAASTPVPSPAPAPAPASLPVNITSIIKSAGLFTTFLNLLIVTEVDEFFQAQANNSETGITIFCPTDKAFAALPAATINKLTAQEKTDLVKSHALSAFYPLASLQQFTDPVTPTLATNSHGGGTYTVKITYEAGSVVISTAHVRSTIISTLYNMDPVGIFAINKVLLPREIFGLPAPSPSPSPSPYLPPQLPPSISPSPSSSSKPVRSHGISPAGGQSNGSPSLHCGPFMVMVVLILGGLGKLIM